MEKYYLQIEIRFTKKEGEGEHREITHYSKSLQSFLFDTEQECVDYGNKIIENNLWMEQYPGYIGARLARRWGRPLQMFSLRNGGEIFISVEKIFQTNMYGLEELLKELK